MRGTSDVAIYYSGSCLQVNGYVDANFSGDRDKRKSTIGYVFSSARGVDSWVSKLQTEVTLSTTEAKYMVATHASKEAIWLHRLLDELQVKQDNMVLHYDSQSALHLVCNLIYHSRTKHIDTKYHFVHEVVEGGQMSFAMIHTDVNPTYITMKTIGREKFI